MRGPENNIDDVGELRQNPRQSVQHMLDAFVGREQPEGQQHHAAFHAELIFKIGRIDKADIRDAVRDQIDLGRRHMVNVLEHPASAFRHDHQARGERGEIIHDAPLLGPRRL